MMELKHEWGISASSDGPRICRKCGAIEGYTIGKGFGDNRDEPCPGNRRDA